MLDSIRSAMDRIQDAVGDAVAQASANVEANLEPETADAAPPAGKPVAQKADGSYDLTNLGELSQHDALGSTAGDRARCSANSTVVALVHRGPDALLGGIAGARKEIEARIDAAGGTTEARQAWAGQLAHLDQVERDVRAGKLDTNDLSQLGSVLYQVFDSDKSDAIMKYGDIGRMNEAVGLLPKGYADQLAKVGLSLEEPIEEPDGEEIGVVTTKGSGAKESIDAASTGVYDQAAASAARERAASYAFDQLEKGESALVGVYNGTGVDKPNHIVTIGKDKSGALYCYDPSATPNYYTGDAAKAHVASKVGVKVGDPRPLNDDSGNRVGTEYPLTAAVTFIKQK